MSSRIREYTPNDYSMLCSWWNTHKFPPPPEAIFPQVGVIIDECAAGFLYQTDSAIAWVEWIVVDPVCDKIKRRQALDLLIDELSALAKNKGFKVIFTSVEHEGLMDRLKTKGFAIGDTKVTQMFRSLS